MAQLDRKGTKKRSSVKQSDFAVPKGKGSKPDQNQYPVDTAARARNALSRVSQYGTPAEKRMVRQKVKKKYPGIGK